MIPPQLLALVPGCEGMCAPQSVQALPGGYGRNEVLRIDTRQGRFVWRRRLGPLDRPGAAAVAELAAHRQAASAGLAPGIVAAAADASWILMEYVDAPPWTEAQLAEAGGVERLGRRVAMLQSLPVPPAVGEADAPAMARGYQARAGVRDAAQAAALQPMVDRVIELTAGLAAFGERKVLAHGDLMASNMLGPLPLLVDWEYAQCADPTWDYACLLSYYPWLESRLYRLLGSAGLDGGQGRARFELQRERFVLLNSLWERAYPSPGAVQAG